MRRLEDGKSLINTLKRRVERAQRRIRRYIKPGRSLADELIAERREAAKIESGLQRVGDPETDESGAGP